MNALHETLTQSLQRGLESGPKWLTQLRESAKAQFIERGLPHSKDEAWRFTRLRSLTELSLQRAPTLTSGGRDAARAILGESADAAVIIANGCVHLPPTLPADLEVLDLAGALAHAPSLLEQHLDPVTGASVFGALNAALFSDILVVRAAKGVDIETPLQIVHVTEGSDGSVVAYPRVLVVAEKHSRLKLVEVFSASTQVPTLTSSLGHVVCKEGAQVHHVRSVQGHPDSRLVDILSADVYANGRYASTTISVGGALSRHELDIRLLEPGAEARLDGLYLASDQEQTDHRTRVDHIAPHTSSVEHYRGIVDGRGSAIFDGTAFVRRAAQGASAQQENRNLLLSDDAVVNTKPHLEIDADNVQCTHGATVGQLSKDELFYLRSRGISEPAARAILTFAFARQSLEAIPTSQERARLAEVVLERLGHPELMELATGFTS